MGIGRQPFVAVLDDDEFAVTDQARARIHHHAVGGGHHGLACRAGDVDALPLGVAGRIAADQLALSGPAPAAGAHRRRHHGGGGHHHGRGRGRRAGRRRGCDGGVGRRACRRGWRGRDRFGRQRRDGGGALAMRGHRRCARPRQRRGGGQGRGRTPRRGAWRAGGARLAQPQALSRIDGVGRGNAVPAGHFAVVQAVPERDAVKRIAGAYHVASVARRAGGRSRGRRRPGAFALDHARAAARGQQAHQDQDDEGPCDAGIHERMFNHAMAPRMTAATIQPTVSM